MGYEFHNKTDEIMYLDLGKSFFIINGIAFDCHNKSTLMSAQTSSYIYSNANLDYSTPIYAQSAGVNQTYTGNFGNPRMYSSDPILFEETAFDNASFSAVDGSVVSNEVSTESTMIESPIVAIPPKSSKFIGNQPLTRAMFLSCERECYPSDSSMTSYSVEDSPLVFSNYISLRVGDNSPLMTIQNEFYVSSITNYAKPSTLVYIERERECDNVLSMDERIKEKQRNFEIYDVYLNINKVGAFFWHYQVTTKTKLYDNSTEYYWNSYYNGYTKYNMNNTNSSSQGGKYVGGKLVE